jgi:hypothetical protein
MPAAADKVCENCEALMSFQTHLLRITAMCAPCTGVDNELIGQDSGQDGGQDGSGT